MPTRYTPAPDVERIALELMREHHRHLMNVDVRFVFRSKATSRCGNVVLGKAKKLTGLPAWLATGGETDDEDAPLTLFLIEIAYDTWEELSPSQQQALVDHELCHCTVDIDDDGGIRLGIRGHDLEEFRAVYQRHGDWKPDVAEFTKTVKQMNLLDQPDDASVQAYWTTISGSMSASPLVVAPTIAGGAAMGEAVQDGGLMAGDDTAMTNEEFEQRMAGVVLVATSAELPPSEGAVPPAPSGPTTEEIDMAQPEQPENGETVARVDDLTDVERIAPEPLPPAPPRQNGDGPRIAPFNPDDIPAGPEPASAVERTPLRDRSGGKRDGALAAFLAE